LYAIKNRKNTHYNTGKILAINEEN